MSVPVEKTNAYQDVTARIINGLKNDKCAWRRTWAMAHVQPHNFISKYQYNGINYLLGLIDQALTGRPAMYATYNQIANSKKPEGHVKAGSKHSKVYFSAYMFFDKDGKKVDPTIYKNMSKEDKKAIKVVPYLKSFQVFNVMDTEGFEELVPKLEQSDFNPIEKAEKVLARIETVLGCKIERKLGVQACFIPDLDKIQIAPPEGFENTGFYYRTIFHEAIHWTAGGNGSRLKRKSLDDYNLSKDDRSLEELVAEIGSQFLLDYCGINDLDVNDVSQGYINGWIEVLEKNPKWISAAASMAQKAVDYLLGVESKDE